MIEGEISTGSDILTGSIGIQGHYSDIGAIVSGKGVNLIILYKGIDSKEIMFSCSFSKIPVIKIQDVFIVFGSKHKILVMHSGNFFQCYGFCFPNIRSSRIAYRDGPDQRSVNLINPDSLEKILDTLLTLSYHIDLPIHGACIQCPVAVNNRLAVS